MWSKGLEQELPAQPLSCTVLAITVPAIWLCMTVPHPLHKPGASTDWNICFIPRNSLENGHTLRVAGRVFRRVSALPSFPKGLQLGFHFLVSVQRKWWVVLSGGQGSDCVLPTVV